MTGLIKTSVEETRPRSMFPLIVSRDSFSPSTWARFQTGGAWPSLADVFKYLMYCFNHLTRLCNNINGLSAIVCCWSLAFIRRIIYKIFTCVSFLLYSFCGYREGRDPRNRFNHTSWVAIVTPTDLPNKVCNRCVIEAFGGDLFLLSRFFLDFSVMHGLLA